MQREKVKESPLAKAANSAEEFCSWFSRFSWRRKIFIYLITSTRTIDALSQCPNKDVPAFGITQRHFDYAHSNHKNESVYDKVMMSQFSCI